MQDFNTVLTNTDLLLNPWDEILLRWLDEEENQDPTMDIVVQHAKIHRARWIEIADRPKRMLSRTREIVNLSRVEELDTHCMIWLSRQPGRTTPERGGVNQRILARTRYENFDTLENRVFRDLLERTDAAAHDYLRQNARRRTDEGASGREGRYTMVEHYAWECKRLARELTVLGVSQLKEGPVQPNFVLMQDIRYRHVWTAWNEMVARERWYDDLWRWQRRAWAEFAKMACSVSLRSVQGGEIEFASPLYFRSEHRRGEWVMHDDPLVVSVFRKIGVVVEVLDGYTNDLTNELIPLCSSAWLRISELQNGKHYYIAVWTVLTLGNAASLSNLVESADKTVAKLQQINPTANLASGIIIQSEANIEADINTQRGKKVTGLSFSPFGLHLARGIEHLGQEIVNLIERKCEQSCRN